jgi:hypothetical protein
MTDVLISYYECVRHILIKNETKRQQTHLYGVSVHIDRKWHLCFLYTSFCDELIEHNKYVNVLFTVYYLRMAVHSLCALLTFLLFNLCAVGRIPWTGDQPVASPLPTHRTTRAQNTHRTNAHRHSCLEWDSNPPNQYSRRSRRFMPETARPLCSASIYLPSSITYDIRLVFSVDKKTLMRGWLDFQVLWSILHTCSLLSHRG